jgi:hypothetical protein
MSQTTVIFNFEVKIRKLRCDTAPILNYINLGPTVAPMMGWTPKFALSSSTAVTDTEQVPETLDLSPSMTHLRVREQFSEISPTRMLPISFQIFNYALLVFMVWYFPIDKFVELEKLLGCMNWLSVLCSLCCEVKLTRKLRICLAGWLPFTSRSGTSV